MNFYGAFRSVKSIIDLQYIDFETIYKPLLNSLKENNILFEDNESVFDINKKE